MSEDNDAVEWANRVMIAAAGKARLVSLIHASLAIVIYFYDFLLTFLSEIEYCGRHRLFPYIFASVRTTSCAYQMIVVVKISLDSWTSKVSFPVIYHTSLTDNPRSICNRPRCL